MDKRCKKSPVDGTSEDKKITLRLPNALYQGLQAEAERRGLSVSHLISIILEDYFQNVVQE